MATNPPKRQVPKPNRSVIQWPLDSDLSIRWLLILCILATLVACQTAPTPVASTQAVSAPTSAALVATTLPAAPACATPLYKDASQPAEKRVEDLLARMTLDEKIGQMTQIEHPYSSQAKGPTILA